MTSRPVLATPVAAAMPPAAAPAPSASVRGLPKPTQPPVTAARPVFTCTTSFELGLRWASRALDLEEEQAAAEDAAMEAAGVVREQPARRRATTVV